MNNGYEHLLEENNSASAEECMNYIEKYNKEICNKLSHEEYYHQVDEYN